MKYLATAITNSVMWLCSTAIILYVFKEAGSMLSLFFLLIPALSTIAPAEDEPTEKEAKKEVSE